MDTLIERKKRFTPKQIYGGTELPQNETFTQV